jgi:ABC-type antimicrobial peptide transport system permease subunit
MFFTYLRRELGRRRRQSLVVSIGLAVGIGLVLTVTSLASGVRTAQATVLHSLYGVGTDATVTQAAAQPGTDGRFGFGGPPGGQNRNTQRLSRDRLTARGLTALSASTVTTVRKVHGVAAASGDLALTDLQFTGTIPSPSQRGTGPPQGGASTGGGSSGRSSFNVNSFSVEGLDATSNAVGPLTSATATSGRLLTAADSTKKVALLDSSYAKQKSLKVGSKVTVAGKSFTVVGIVRATSSATTSANVYIPLPQAQALAGMSGKVNTVYVRAADASQVSGIKSSIQQVLPKATVSTSSDLAGQVSGSLSSASGLANNLGKWLSIAVLVVVFLMASLFTLSAVTRRTAEFGTLKALGWRSRRVVGQVMGESLTLCILGGIVGIALGFGGAALVKAFAPPLSATVGNSALGTARAAGAAQRFGGGGPFGQAQQALHTVDVHLATPITLDALLLAVLLAVAGGLIAGSLGGWRASRLRPAAAFRTIQ